ncbi:hypothetical protein AG1IA_02727 [Rhizoctonia solani AG-1 IA]|uniref:Uncharacterized protein n=1 Tax=Thanatephorus cucumeris (strain AG1-IA) TaxID=983506 RepID=L8X3N4_THACA|nr:hypothetical protein AG1IA_02727 [Rhizoctonia solani AG-1 IA]
MSHALRMRSGGRDRMHRCGTGSHGLSLEPRQPHQGISHTLVVILINFSTRWSHGGTRCSTRASRAIGSRLRTMVVCTSCTRDRWRRKCIVIVPEGYLESRVLRSGLGYRGRTRGCTRSRS